MLHLKFTYSPDPLSVRVADDSGRILALLDSAQLDQAICAGKLSCADLWDTSPQGQHRLIRRLILLACAQSCRSGMACLAVDCPLHPQHHGCAPLSAAPIPSPIPVHKNRA